MKNKRKITLIFSLAIIISIATVAKAQVKWGTEWKIFTKDYTYDMNYNDGQKLHSNYVRAVAVDKDGAAWIADLGTLRIYKDFKFSTMGRKQYGSPAYINALKFDDNGVLWIGCSKGLYKYENNVFQHIEVPELSDITEIAINKEGHIYVVGFKNSAQKGGLSIYDGTSWKNYNPDNSEMPKRLIQNIAIDNDGSVWMTSGTIDHGLVKFDGEKWTRYDKKNCGLPSNTIRSITFDSKGNGWFSTPKGVVKYDGSTWKVYTLKDLFQLKQMGVFNKLVTEVDVQSIAFDKNDVMWVATNASGIIRIENDSRSIIATGNSPMTSDKIIKIYVDNQNRKWFMTGTYPGDRRTDNYKKNYGTVTDGFTGMVMYKDPKYDHFDNWEILNSFTTSLPSSYLFKTKEAPDGSMWIAGGGGFNNKGGEWSVYQQANTYNTLTSVDINSKGEVYFGSSKRGIFKVDGDSIINFNADEWGLLNDHTIDICIDQEDNIWLASIKGLNMCKDGKCKSFTKKTGLLSSNIYFLKTDSKGRVWVGTPKGASVYDHGKWISYSKKESGLVGYVYDMAEDNDGNFWAATGRGIFKLEGNKWTKIEPKSLGNNGPKSLIAKSIAFDKEGTMWVGTLTYFLYSFDGQEWKHYNSNNSGILFRTVRNINIRSNGDIWFTNQKSTSSSSSSTGSMDPNATPDPSIAIRKAIDNFEPSHNIVILKK